MALDKTPFFFVIVALPRAPHMHILLLPNKSVLQPTYGVRGQKTLCPQCNSKFHMSFYGCSDMTYINLRLVCVANNNHVYHMTYHSQIKYVFKLCFYTILFRKKTSQWRLERKEKRNAALIAIRTLNEVCIREKIICMANLW